MSLELLVTDDQKGFFLELLSSYLQLVERGFLTFNKVKESTRSILKLNDLPLLTFPNGEKILSDDIQIAETLARVSGFYEVIFGKSGEEIKSNHQFIGHLKNNLQNDATALLRFLNQHLIMNTFCNGFLLNVSDIYAYSMVAPSLKGLSDNDKYANCNLIRWADHIQNLKGINQKISDSKLKFTLPYEPFFLDVVEVKKDNKSKIAS